MQRDCDLVCQSVFTDWAFTVMENLSQIEWLQTELYYQVHH